MKLRLLQIRGKLEWLPLVFPIKVVCGCNCCRCNPPGIDQTTIPCFFPGSAVAPPTNSLEKCLRGRVGNSFSFGEKRSHDRKVPFILEIVYHIVSFGLMHYSHLQSDRGGQLTRSLICVSSYTWQPIWQLMTIS